MLTQKIKKEISSLFKSIGKDDEFEIMFNNYKKDNKLAIMDFMKVMKYLKWRADNDKSVTLVEHILLDVIYATDNKNVFRVSINNKENMFYELKHKNPNKRGS